MYTSPVSSVQLWNAHECIAMIGAIYRAAWSAIKDSPASLQPPSCASSASRISRVWAALTDLTQPRRAKLLPILVLAMCSGTPTTNDLPMFRAAFSFAPRHRPRLANGDRHQTRRPFIQVLAAVQMFWALCRTTPPKIVTLKLNNLRLAGKPPDDAPTQEMESS